ncbi:MAG TPA: signal peptidase I [Kofleriaceae bacterium]|nr:signal peptidase I [Kofleriaceae bacterium]
MSSSPPPVRSRTRRIAREILTVAVFALVLMSARASLADHYLVPTGSMQPTVEIDDHVLVNKAAYGLRVPFSHSYLARFGGPAAGDVVVLDAPDEDKVLLKRVVGVPGTRVEVRGGRIWLDGKLAPVESRGDELFEQLGRADHALRLTRGGGPDWGPVTIPDDRYLVMGDNRGDSRDGRFFGLVTREAILGRAVGVIWRSGPTWDGL